MISNREDSNIQGLAKLLLKSKYALAFTGAGISVDSGIPSFRGKDGIWSKYDPSILELSNYYYDPKSCWHFIKEIFYDKLKGVKPNTGHYALTKLQQMGLIKSIFTQNIDNLHQESGSINVYEFHGNTKYFVCAKCKKKYSVNEICLEEDYPKCPDCLSLVKPDFIFFSEELPRDVLEKAYSDAENADLIIVIGCSGEVFPANQIPYFVKQTGGKVVEINPHLSLYSETISDLRIVGKSQDILQKVVDSVKKIRENKDEK